MATKKTTKEPSPNAQHQAAWRARNRDAGLKTVSGLWAHPDDVPKIRAYAARLAKKRESEVNGK